MMPDFLLPDLGEGLTEAEILSWLVDVGDEVRIDQPVVEVETAKAVVEVPVPFAGTVTALHGRPGQSLAVGRPLITVGASSDGAGFREPGVVNGSVAPEDSSNSATGASGNVLIGYGTPATLPGRRRRRALSVPDETSARTTPVLPEVPTVISPPVRLLARRAGLDLTLIVGSGPAGVIRRADVERAIAVRSADDDGAQSVSVPVSAAVSAPAGDRRIPMSSTRRYIAEKMTKSRREIPEATVWVDVDATDLLAARAEINRRDPDRQVSVLGLFCRLTLLGLRRYPELNGRVDGNDIVLPAHVRLGFAAQTDRGLVVPVIGDADLLTARELSASIGTATAAARAGSLSLREMSGGTFSVNNYGVFGVDGSAAIINHPEVAMLGLGRIIDRPWVVDGQVVARKIAQLSLVFDHRVCDGAVAGGFLRFVADCVESPLSALADL